MKFTFNGCSRSNMTVSPRNWRSSKASTKKAWKIFYRFYDPTHKKTYPGGKDCPVRGMNKFTDLADRQEATKALLENELDLVDIQGYNPITKEYMAPEDLGSISLIHRETGLMDALHAAAKMLELEGDTPTDMKSMLKYFGMSAEQLGKSEVAVAKVRRGEIIQIMDNCKNLYVTDSKGKKRKKIWTPNQFNHYRKYLSMIYNQLDIIEAIEYNPIAKIPIKDTAEIHEHVSRTVLSDEERIDVDAYLKSKLPTFHRFVHIFFHSGARRTELMRLKGRQVDLRHQTFKVLVKKRRRKTWVTKTIKDVALPFWEEALQGCGPDDYVFSKDLKPGPQAIRPDQVTKRWKRHIKALGIEADLYSLKHLNTTETVVIAGDELAAEQNSHTSTAMVVNIYDVGRSKRDHEKLKKVKNKFA